MNKKIILYAVAIVVSSHYKSWMSFLGLLLLRNKLRIIKHICGGIMEIVGNVMLNIYSSNLNIFFHKPGKTKFCALNLIHFWGGIKASAAVVFVKNFAIYSFI